MKAVKLKVAAFGPYRNEQIVDFNQLKDESIFLVTGPTGAGKTTIFDAMCFALYGKASGSDRDQDTLRSHFAPIQIQTMVEFVFQLRGKTYRVIRSPRQQKKKDRGEGFTEEPSRAELYILEETGEKLVASRIKDVNESLEEMISLDYEQFRKMIMIPQGEFRKLISENSKEREEILQRIFHTHFYEQLTESLKRQAKELKGNIENHEWKISQAAGRIDWQQEEVNIEECDNKELMEKISNIMERYLKDLTKLEAEYKQQAKTVESAQEAFYQDRQLKEKFNLLREYQKEKQNLLERRESIQHIEKQWTNAQKALEIAPYEELWRKRQEEYEKLNKNLEEKKRDLKNKREHFELVSSNYKQEADKEEEREQQKEKIRVKKGELEKLERIGSLYKQSVQKTDELSRQDKLLEQMEKNKAALTEEKNQKESIAKQANEANKSLYEIKELLQEEQRKRAGLEKVEKLHDKLVRLRRDYQVFKNRYERNKSELEEAKHQLEKEQAGLNEHHAYLLSHSLHKNEPCPVCGSTDHPFPANRPEGIATLEKVEELQSKVKWKEEAVKQEENDYIQIKSDGSSHKQLTESAFEEVADLLPELTEEAIKKALAKQREKVKAIKEEQASIERKLTYIFKAAEEAEKLEKDMEETEKEINRQTEKQHLLQKETIKLEALMEQLKEGLSHELESKEQLSKEVVELEKDYINQVKQWEETQAQHEKLKEQVQRMDAEVSESTSHLTDINNAVEETKGTFIQLLKEYGFMTPDDYQQSKMPKENVSEMKEKIDNYKQRLGAVTDQAAELETLVQDREEPDLEDSKRNWAEAEQVKENMSKHINAVQMELQSLKNVHSEVHMLWEEIKDLQEEYYDIGELADLAKGENHLRLSFERYVLSSFLDEILMQANIRLDQMTDHRYQLIRSDQVAKRGAQSGLDLEVMDHHTGLQRSVKTLSGGEGFKAALCLALGMADVVQAHAGGVQLDTLFIDEGFGTLDELSLEQAIGCLKELQDGNRLLGIISHVPQLKEEIRAKLQITPSPEGSSVKFVFH
ncbi:AAA family ATPase [Thalassobacillus pellis]|uniref:AAA family ATPase n=1 Tax=Thalassobacillus pellis TaxID=748008 RepID=UPI0019603E01|nr:AAA family ATPase [Thalassobacillus pellis]MBM7552535.1 exonuclease SbcC [Thalassobacillus pellis]